MNLGASGEGWYVTSKGLKALHEVTQEKQRASIKIEDISKRIGLS